MVNVAMLSHWYSSGRLGRQANSAANASHTNVVAKGLQAANPRVLHLWTHAQGMQFQSDLSQVGGVEKSASRELAGPFDPLRRRECGLFRDHL